MKVFVNWSICSTISILEYRLYSKMEKKKKIVKSKYLASNHKKTKVFTFVKSLLHDTIRSWKILNGYINKSSPVYHISPTLAWYVIHSHFHAKCSCGALWLTKSTAQKRGDPNSVTETKWEKLRTTNVLVSSDHLRIWITKFISFLKVIYQLGEFLSHTCKHKFSGLHLVISAQHLNVQ